MADPATKDMLSGGFIQSLRDRLHSMTLEGDANTRKYGRVPIRTNEGEVPFDPGEVYGRYDPHIGIGGPRISMNIDPEATSSTIFDTLKHEIVHHLLHGVDLPDTERATKQFRTIMPDGRALKNQPDPGWAAPANNWNWESNMRLGNPTAEVPAYMSVYNPKQINVPKPTRDMYMQDLYNYLGKAGKSDVANRIKSLLVGRQHYVDSPTLEQLNQK